MAGLLKKMIVEFSSRVKMAYAVWSLTNNWIYWLRWKAEW